MIQGGRCGRLLLKTPQPLGIGSKRRRQDLDGDVAAQPQVARAVHFSHAARAEQRLDLVISEAVSIDDLKHIRKINQWLPLTRCIVRRLLKNDFPDQYFDIPE
jgi:hypothetical protein